MNSPDRARLADVLNAHRDGLLADWIRLHMPIALRRGLAIESEIREQFATFLYVFLDTLARCETLDGGRPEWEPVRAFLTEISVHRARQGFTPVETATFVFSLKQPLYASLRESFDDAVQLTEVSWSVNLLLDHLGLDGGRLHYQRHPSADRPDDCAPGRGPGQCHYKVDPR